MSFFSAGVDSKRFLISENTLEPFLICLHVFLVDLYWILIDTKKKKNVQSLTKINFWKLSFKLDL